MLRDKLAVLVTQNLYVSVQMRNGQRALIYCVEHTPGWPLAGSIEVPGRRGKTSKKLMQWQNNGRYSTTHVSQYDLVA